MYQRFEIMRSRSLLSTALGLAALLLSGCAYDEPIRIHSDDLQLEFDHRLYSRIVAVDPASGATKSLGPFSPTETLATENEEYSEFQTDSQEWTEVSDAIGEGQKVVLEGSNSVLRKQVAITTYADFPRTSLLHVTYTNVSEEPLTLKNWTNNRYRFSSEGDSDPEFWSFQGGSYESRPDWVLPVESGFSQQNFQGMNATDYGGGVPVSDVWRKDIGIGVGHLALTPKQTSLPVDRSDATHVTLGVGGQIVNTLQPGESYTTLPTFVHIHKRDYFETLSTYRSLMTRKGIEFPSIPDEAYEPIWCAWGYQRDFKLSQVYGTLPKVRELGIQWVVLDDGWQNAEGDWYVLEEKFPGGEKGMQRYVKRLHDEGFKAKLWWAPLAVDPGTELSEQHPEYLLLNEGGSTQRISWWDADYLCPAYAPVQDYTVALVEKIIGQWGYDGLKIDGQHLNGAPPCYNEAHNHESPEEAAEAVPEFFRLVMEAATRIKPNAVVEICPCGATYSFFSLPVMNQPVSSDPESSWQIRLKGKTIKALMGPQAPYYGDRVELSDGGTDFGSAVALSIVREMGPVMTVITVTARAGSAVAAEIGIMRISEQIDALETMDINPIRFLVSPRIQLSFSEHSSF